MTTFSKTALSLLLLAGGFVVAKTLGPPDLAQKLVSSWRPDPSNQWGDLRPAAQGDHQAEWLAPLDAIEMPASFSSAQASVPASAPTSQPATQPAAQPWSAPPQQAYQANKAVATDATSAWPEMPSFGAPALVNPALGNPAPGLQATTVQSAGGQTWGSGAAGELQTSSYEEEMVDLRQYNKPAVATPPSSSSPSSWPTTPPVQAKEVSAAPDAGWPQTSLQQSPMNQIIMNQTAMPQSPSPPAAEAWPGAPSTAAWPSAPGVASQEFGPASFGGDNSPPPSPVTNPMLQASASPPVQWSEGAQWSQESQWSGGADQPMAPLGASASSGEASSEAAARKTHIVTDGDSLPKLAERYLGDAGRSSELYEQNRQLLTHPDLLPLGVELRIP